MPDALDRAIANVRKIREITAKPHSFPHRCPKCGGSNEPIERIALEPETFKCPCKHTWTRE